MPKERKQLLMAAAAAAIVLFIYLRRGGAASTAPADATATGSLGDAVTTSRFDAIDQELQAIANDLALGLPQPPTPGTTPPPTPKPPQKAGDAGIAHHTVLHTPKAPGTATVSITGSDVFTNTTTGQATTKTPKPAPGSAWAV